MIGSKTKTLKEEIVELLLEHPLTSKQIHSFLQQKRGSLTIQAVYKQLNALLEEQVVIKNSDIYSISNEWIKRISSILNIQDVALPEEGEKISYRFNSLQKLDAHWKHIISSFRKKFKKEAFFSYCPHQFWIYVPTRSESEIEYWKEHEEEQYYNFYVIGGNTSLDKKFKKLFQGDFYRIETFPLPDSKRNYHFSVFGDIIVRTRITKDLSKKIDSIYQDPELSNDQKEKKLRLLLSGENKCTFIVERNRKKATQLKKKISKPFYLPEHIRSQLE